MKNKVVVAVLYSIAVTGCSSSILKIDRKGTIQNPEDKYTNLTEALFCAKKAIQKSNDREFGYMYAVSDIVDGTVPPNAGVNSALSDRLHVELIENLYNSTKGYGVILSTFPPMYHLQNMNSSGEVNKLQLSHMTVRQLAKVNEIREAAISYNKINGINEKISLYNNLKPTVVSGTFTRNDETPIQRKNSGLGTGNSGTDTGDTQYGTTTGYKALSLNITMSNPEINQITASKTFTIYTHEADTGLSLNLGIGEGFLNLQNNNILIESKHGAQQTLVDAASLWVLEKTYGSVANIGECLK